MVGVEVVVVVEVEVEVGVEVVVEVVVVMTPTELAKRVLELDRLGTEGKWHYHAGSMVWITGPKGEVDLFSGQPKREYNRRLIAEYRSAAPILAKEVLRRARQEEMI